MRERAVRTMSKIVKTAHVEKQAVGGGVLEKINRYSLRELSEDEVFVFRVAACDDQVDRDEERFTLATLNGLAALFPGRAMLMDHKWTCLLYTSRCV